jgi:peptidyl-prolyl cis-trans isomerase B (cyclophilin B)
MVRCRWFSCSLGFSCALLLLLCCDGFGRDDGFGFADATRPPDTSTPEKSINGKSMAEMKMQVEEAWDGIKFEADGKPVTYEVNLETTAGEIKIRLWPDVAPNHCRSFVALCQVGYYDGLIFHRCIPGFVIQGGCPKGDGSGGPGYCLNPEFNNRKHVAGVLSMARANRPDSAGSQFFICDGDAGFLDNKYTAFGEVVSGMAAVRKIVSAERDNQDRPFKPETIKKATVKQVPSP